MSNEIIFEPKVSIVLPVYNCEEYIRDSLNSLINQTYRNKEVILVNDGSTDNTLRIVKELNLPITIIDQTNQGQSVALNTGWKHATGEIVGYLSADDLFYPTLIEELVPSFLDKNTVIVFPYFNLIDEYSNKIKEVKPTWKSHHDLLTTLNNPIGPGVLFRKTLFEQTNGWSSEFRQLQDLKFWIETCDKGHVLVHHEVLAAFRVHLGSRTFASNSVEKSFEPIRLVQDYFNKNEEMQKSDIYLESLSNAYILSGQLNLRSGRILLGFKYFMHGLSIYKKNIFKYRILRIILNALFAKAYYSYIFPIIRIFK